MPPASAPLRSEIDEIASIIEGGFAQLRKIEQESIAAAAERVMAGSAIFAGIVDPKQRAASVRDVATEEANAIAGDPAWREMMAVIGTLHAPMGVLHQAGARAIPAIYRRSAGIKQIKEMTVDQSRAWWLDAAGSWLLEAGGRVVTRIDMATRMGLAEILASAAEARLGFRDTARNILSLEPLGLSSTQARQLEKYRRLLEGLSPRVIADRMRRRFRRLRRERALIIARTEAREAITQAQLGLYRELEQQGQFDSDRYWVEWRTVDPCPICKALKGQRARAGRPITSNPIASGSRRGTTIAFTGPPAHPRCRCFLITVRVDED